MNFRFIPLEQRLLFDASVAAVVADAVAHPAVPSADAPAGELHPGPVDVKSPSTEDNQVAAAPSAPQSDATPVEQAQSGVHVLVVSDQIPQLQDFIQAISKDTLVVTYHENTASLSDIQNGIKTVLDGRLADSIGFAGHSQAGNFVLTSEIAVTKDSLANSSALQQFWTQIGGMIQSGGRVDFLSCDVAQGDNGDLLAVDALLDGPSGHRDIGIAASSHLLGNAKAGASWFLDYGGIAADKVYFTPLIQNWDGVLDGIIDINTGPADSKPANFTVVEGLNTLFFSAAGASGRELYKTDGITATLVKDIFTTADSSPNHLVSFNNELYFIASDATGRHLFHSDGTAAGTVSIGTQNGVSDLEVSGNRLYFTDSASGLRLFSTDGTTVISEGGQVYSAIGSMTAFNGEVYFAGTIAATGQELYRTNSGSHQTVLVVDIQPGATGSALTDLTVFEESLFFSANRAGIGTELFSYHPIFGLNSYDINPGAVPSNPDNLVSFDKRLYFSVTSPELTLFSIDTLGNIRHEIPSGVFGSGFGAIGQPVPVGDFLFIPQNYTSGMGSEGNTYGIELYKTSGDVTGWALVQDINPTGNGITALFPNVVSGNQIYFAAGATLTNLELWVSNGTAAGTFLFRDINTTGSSAPSNLIVFNGKIYGSATEVGVGIELFNYTLLADNSTPPTVLSKTYETSGGYLGATLLVNSANGLLVGAADSPGSTLTARLASYASHGEVVINPDGSFGYTPDAGYVGVDSFVYTVDDGTLMSLPAQVQILVKASSPAAAASTLIYSEDFQTASVDLSDWSTVANAGVKPASVNPSLTFTTAGAGAADTSARWLGFFGMQTVNLSLTSIAVPHDFISVSFDLILKGTWDGNGSIAELGRFGPDLIKVLIDGSPVMLSTFSNNVTDLNQAFQSFSGNFQSGDTHPSNTGAFAVNTLGHSITNSGEFYRDVTYRLSYLIPTTDSTLSLAIQGLMTQSDPTGPQTEEVWGIDNVSVTAYPGADLSTAINYTTPASAGAAADFTVSVTNDGPSTALGTVVHLSSPLAISVNGSLPAGVSFSATNDIVIDALASGQTLSLFFTQSVPANFGSTLLSTTAEITDATAYDSDSTPNNHIATEDDQAIATVSVEVAPVANADNYSSFEDQLLSVSAANGVLNNDSDANVGDTFTAVLNSQGTYGTVNLNSDGSFTYQPTDLNYNGPDTFTYTSVDNHGLSNGFATVTINVQAVNDVPTFDLGADQSVLEGSGAHTVAGFYTNASAGPADEASQVLTPTVTNNNAGLFSSAPTIDAAGVLSYTLAAGQSGTAIVTVTLVDGGGTSNGGVDTTVKTFNVFVENVSVISGSVFQDVNTLGSQVGAAFRPGVTLRIYSDNGSSVGLPDATDSLVATVFTDPLGHYTFVGTDGIYWIAVDSTTVTPVSGVNGNPFVVWADQTYAPVGGVQFDGSSYSFSAAAGTLYGGKTVSGSDSALTLLGSEHLAKVALTSDTSNIDFGFSFSVIDNTNGSNAASSLQGSLRQFISNSNKLNSLLTSEFRIGAVGSGQTISISGAILPNIVKQVILTGFTQGGIGYSGNPLIELSGAAFGVSGNEGAFSVNGGSATIIEGLSITGFRGFDVATSAANVVIRHNWFGLSRDGVTIGVNKGTGNTSLYLLNNTTVTDNVILSNRFGIDMFGGTNVISANKFGTLPDGNTAATFIGGPAIRFQPGAGGNVINNVIGKVTVGIRIDNGNTKGINIFGNHIGVGADGITAIPNSGAGILVASTIVGTSGVTIGSATDPTKANIISGNGSQGIFIDPLALDITVRGNSIYNNGLLGIDLSPTGVNANDNLDVDNGANSLQNYPVITSVTASGASIIIQGTLNSSPNKQFFVDLYANTTPDASGQGEGEVYLGEVTVITDANGNASFSKTVTNPGKLYIAATATNSEGDTSEFSANHRVNSPPVANDDVYSTFEDAVLTVLAPGIKSNDSDADDSLISQTIAIVQSPTNGILAFDSSGKIIYGPQPNFYGVDTFTYTLFDGNDFSNQATVTITVNPVNDPPTFTLGPSPASVQEDSGAHTVTGFYTNASAGPNEGTQALTLTVTSTNPSLFSSGPFIDSFGNLHYTSASNQFGLSTVTVTLKDNGGTINGGIDTLVKQFTINIIPVNDAPTFDLGADQSVLEDSGAHTVAGFYTNANANENGQTLTLSVTNDNAGLFASAPTIDSSGDLHYTLAGDQFGTATVTVTLSDDGGTSNSGVDALTKTFTIDVLPVNDAPNFDLGADESVLEDSGAHTVAGFYTNANANENGQTLTLSVSNDNAGLFASAPTIDSSGDLHYTLAADQFGTATVTVTLSDDGGTSNSGVDALTKTFTIDVLAVNDAPTFDLGADQSVLEDSGAHTVAGFYTNANANENGQTLTLSVTNDNAGLFASAPTIDSSGDLHYTLAADQFGTATVTVTLSDDGGTSNGGANALTKTFTIDVLAVNDAPTFDLGADQSALEDSGAHTVAGFYTNANANENGQTLTLSVTNDNAGLFASAPTIDSSGDLHYTLAADQFGTATVTVTLSDDGGTSNSGVDALTKTFTIDVLAVNDAPTFDLGADQSVLEDSGANTVVGFYTNTSAGPNEDAQALTLTVTNDNAALFSSAPTIDSSGDLHYTLAADQFGTATVTVTLSDDGGTSNGGANALTKTFTIDVLAVNDAPTFDLGADQSALEDSGSHTVMGFYTNASAGPSNENGQALTLAVTNDNAGLFTSAPTIDSSGDLHYTLAADQFGTATVTVTLSDDGGTSNGGANALTKTFTIDVLAVNDAPTFDLGADQSVLEDSGAHTVAGFYTNANANENGQTLTLSVTNDNAGLFASAPTIDSSGDLHYTLAADQFGTATVTVTLSDDGGTSNSGVDALTKTFTIDVLAVNDAPTFDLGADQSVLEDSGAHTVAGFYTNASAGPNEDAQALTLTVTNDNAALFSSAPTIDSSGDLHYTLAADQFGTATVTVTLSDDGGTSNSGVDALTKTFTIDVLAVNDAPTFDLGANQSVLEDSGAHTVAGFYTNANANENGQTLTLSVTNDNAGLFSSAPTIDSSGDLHYTLAADQFGTATVTVTLSDDGGTSNGGANALTKTFTIDVLAVNDAPTFGLSEVAIVSLEDSGPKTASGWADAISAGPTNEMSQELHFVLTTNNDALFSVLPTIDATTGALHYTTALNANGSATVTAVLKDDAGGSDSSVVRTFVIDVTPVNDAPSFNEGSSVLLLNGSGSQTIPNFATNIVAGPSNEASQTVHFELLTDNTALFQAPPSMDANGQLSFTPVTGAVGSSIVKVTLVDSGGAVNGGVDRTVQFFTVFFNSVQNPSVSNANPPFLHSAHTFFPDMTDDTTEQHPFLIAAPNGFYGVDGYNQMSSTGEMIGFDDLAPYNESQNDLLLIEVPANSWDVNSSNYFEIDRVLGSARETLGVTSDANLLKDLFLRSANGDQVDDILHTHSYDRLLDLLEEAEGF